MAGAVALAVGALMSILAALVMAIHHHKYDKNALKHHKLHDVELDDKILLKQIGIDSQAAAIVDCCCRNR